MFPTSAELQLQINKLEDVYHEMHRLHDLVNPGQIPCKFLSVGNTALDGSYKLKELLETAKFIERRQQCNS